MTTAKLSWNEIRRRAVAFTERWSSAASERAKAKTFNDELFGTDGRRLASFEPRDTQFSGRARFIDLCWPGLLLIAHKSRGA